MAILIVANEFPWPTADGLRMRIANTVEALAEIGEIDLVSIVDETDGQSASQGPPAIRTLQVRRPVPRRRPVAIVEWLRGHLPRDLAGRDWERARAELRRWRRSPYDLVWFTACESYVGLGPFPEIPTVVDFDNLESRKIGHRLALGLDRDPTQSMWRRAVAARADRVDAARWKTLEHKIASEAKVVAVCSALDIRRLGAPNAVVVPNGYARMALRPTNNSAGPPVGPVLLFIGLLIYPPNVDAAMILANEILPRVRIAVAGATLRLVGRASPEVEALAGIEGVEIVGRVVDVAPELAGAAVVVAPIRFGGGTRVKILEAFAHGIPVVSTTVGCEGLEVEHGRHLLIADTMDDIAAAVVRIVTDDPVRAALTANALQLYEDLYRWDRIRPEIGRVAREVIDSGLLP